MGGSPVHARAVAAPSFEVVFIDETGSQRGRFRLQATREFPRAVVVRDDRRARRGSRTRRVVCEHPPMPTSRRPSPAKERTCRQARRLQAAELFARGVRAAQVARTLSVSRQHARIAP